MLKRWDRGHHGCQHLRFLPRQVKTLCNALGFAGSKKLYAAMVRGGAGGQTHSQKMASWIRFWMVLANSNGILLASKDLPKRFLHWSFFRQRAPQAQ